MHLNKLYYWLFGFMLLPGIVLGGNLEELSSSLPQKTIALLSIPDQKSALVALNRAPMGKMINHPQFAAVRESILKKFTFSKDTNRIDVLASNPISALSLEKISSAYLAVIDSSNSKDPLTQSIGGVTVLGLELGENIVALSNIFDSFVKIPQLSPFIKKELFAPNQEIIGFTLSKERSEKILSFFSCHKPNKDIESTNLTFWATISRTQFLIELNSPEGIKEILKVRSQNAPSLLQSAQLEKHKFQFADSVLWGWIYLTPITQKWIEKETAQMKNLAQTDESTPTDPLSENQDSLMIPLITSKLGLQSFISGSFAVYDRPTGIYTDYYIYSPAGSRQGIGKLLSIDAGDCTPPPFIKKDISHFSRMRLNIPAAANNIQSLINDIMPDVCDLLVSAILPGLLEKEPNFNFQKQLIAPLGNDIISCEKINAKGEKDVIRFVQVNEGEKYVESVKNVISILAPIPTIETQTGKYKIVSLPVPNLELTSLTNYYHIAAKDSYLLMSNNRKMIEQFLNETNQEQSLSSLSGLTNAAHIGGFHTGFFEYNNNRSIARSYYNKFLAYCKQSRTQPFLFPIFSILAQDINIDISFIKNITSTLPMPDFESFQECFNYSITIFQSNPDAFIIRNILPVTKDSIQSISLPTPILEINSNSTLPQKTTEQPQQTNDTSEEIIIPEADIMEPLLPQEEDKNLIDKSEEDLPPKK